MLVGRGRGPATALMVVVSLVVGLRVVLVVKTRRFVLVLRSPELGWRLEAMEPKLARLPALGRLVRVEVGLVVGSFEVRWTRASVELMDMHTLLIRLELLAVRAGVPFPTTVGAMVSRVNIHH